jgi:hypothetical protein
VDQLQPAKTLPPWRDNAHFASADGVRPPNLFDELHQSALHSSLIRLVHHSAHGCITSHFSDVNLRRSKRLSYHGACSDLS